MGIDYSEVGQEIGKSLRYVLAFCLGYWLINKRKKEKKKEEEEEKDDK